ncbi:hypothetical protein HNR53_002994 [Bacillus benzoevorans]|uniref:DUF4231 domain-containing protein n=2 Tax=Bacillus benzoevorans TaxID=1456 RepID=A0A7X0LXB0_9BACI|nr:hypothetical protein [Bacillus benzoevorans]
MVKKQSKLSILMRDLDGVIAVFEKRRRRHKKKAYRLKISSIIGTALVTVLLGLKSIHNDLLSDLTLCISAIITIFNSIEGFYNHQGLWVKDVKTLARLWELKRDVEFLSAGEAEEEIPDDILMRYKNRLQRICYEDIKTWSHIKENQIESDGKSHEM